MRFRRAELVRLRFVGGFEKQGRRRVRFWRAGSVRLRFVGGFLEKAGEEVADFQREFRIVGFGKSNACDGFEK